MERYTLHLGDCLETLRAMPACSVDSIVTDPPYGLSFMGKRWDYDVPSTEIWAECLRVLKPGGHLLAFAGTRTQHRMAVRIEDAGFEIRDMIAWVYGSGFPKSLDVSKAIDKMGGVDVAAFKADLRRSVEESCLSRKNIDSQCGFTMRFDTPYSEDPKGWGVSLPSPEKWEIICRVVGIEHERWSELIERVWRGRAGAEVSRNGSMSGANYERADKGNACTQLAQQWSGWGTALKPAMEPITVARKPLAGTVAANVLAHGAGALNIDGCRVHSGDSQGYAYAVQRMAPGADQNKTGKTHQEGVTFEGHTKDGRWPANLIHDGSDEVVALFPDAPGQQGVSSDNQRSRANCYGALSHGGKQYTPRADSGSAARFFYCAKTSRKDRNEGLQDPGPQFAHGVTLRKVENTATTGNTHPTVKPTDLMAYLCRLVTPPGGIVLDPFMGSGSTGKAAIREGLRFIGCELDAAYLSIARARIEHEASRMRAAKSAPASTQLEIFA